MKINIEQPSANERYVVDIQDEGKMPFAQVYERYLEVAASDDLLAWIASHENGTFQLVAAKQNGSIHVISTSF